MSVFSGDRVYLAARVLFFSTELFSGPCFILPFRNSNSCISAIGLHWLQTMDRFLIKHSAKSKAPEEPTPPKKTKIDYDRKYDQGKRKRVFQSSWLTEFRWLRVDDAGTATCKICREFPFIADQKSAFYTGTPCYSEYFVR